MRYRQWSPRLMPHELGIVALRRWVIQAPDVATFRERRNQAEDIICQRMGTFAAMLFVEQACNPKLHLVIAREKARDNESWKRHVQWARHVSKEIKEAILAGKPNPRPITKQDIPTEYQLVVELAYDMASTGLVLPCEEIWWRQEAEARQQEKAEAEAQQHAIANFQAVAPPAFLQQATTEAELFGGESPLPNL